MKLIILLLFIALSFAKTKGQCDSLQIIADVDRINEVKNIEERSHSLSVFIEELIDNECYEVAFGQQMNKIEFSRANFPFHIEYIDLVFFDSLVLRYSKKIKETIRDSFLTENLIAWANFNERTGHHSKTIEKFEIFKSKYNTDSTVLPDKLIIAAERSFRRLGNEYYGNKDYGIALDYYNEAKELCSKMTDEEKGLARRTLHQGYILYIHLKYDKAVISKSMFYDHLNMAKKLFDLDENYLGHLLMAYRNLSELHLLYNNLDSAKYYIGQHILLEKRLNRLPNSSLKIKSRIFLNEGNLSEAQKILRNLFEMRRQNNDPSKYIQFRENLEIADLLIDANMFKEAKILLEFIENINNERMKIDDNNHPKFYSNKNIYLDILLTSLRANNNINRDSIANKIMNAYQIINEGIEKAFSNEAKLNFASQSAQFTEFSLMSLFSTDEVKIDDVFYAIESSKAATSFKSWLQNQLINFDNHESLIFEEQEIENLLNKITNALTEPIDSIRMNELEMFLAKSKLKLDSIKNLLEDKHPIYYHMKYNWSIPNLSKVQESLDNDEVLINYFEGEENLYAIVIATDYARTILIDSVSVIKDSIARYSKNLQEEKHWTKFRSTTSNYIYQKIVAPLEDHLKERVIVSPSGSLFQVPFSALNLSSKKDNFDYFLYDHAVSVVPSASLLYQLRNMDENNSIRNALFVAPKFSNPLPARSAYASRSELYALDYNVPEVKTISKYVDHELLINEDATKKAALNLVSKVDIIHLATHAKSNMDSPDQSFVAFYKSDEKMIDEEFKWFLDDISKQHLTAKMIVLSACETSLGQIHKGEGAMSLANSCFYAGAHSVVAGQWTVGDNATFELMSNFYFNLNQNTPKDKALQMAQIEYLENHSGEKANPFYWAGFSVMGSTSALEFKKTPNYRNWVMSMFGLVALLLFLSPMMFSLKK